MFGITGIARERVEVLRARRTLAVATWSLCVESLSLCFGKEPRLFNVRSGPLLRERAGPLRVALEAPMTPRTHAMGHPSAATPESKRGRSVPSR